MQYTEIMVRYGELSTKGKNKRVFIQQLVKNVSNVLRDIDGIKIKGNDDRMHIHLNGADFAVINERLKKVFGIQTFSPVVRVEKEMSVINATAQEMMREVYTGIETFKVASKRQDHKFELDTYGLNLAVGNAIFDIFPDIKVQMKKPDIELRVDIRSDGAYLSHQVIKGASGYPVGVNSDLAHLMLSGGIDSPVAGYLMLKRGVNIEAVHFASPPYTSPESLEKTKNLTRILSEYSGSSIQFIEVPFTKIQEEIKKHADDGYQMTLTRRMMLRCIDRIRAERGGSLIVNGESLGQVASQTVQSMVAINEVTNTPIIRPVVTMDKTEIIELAERIGTFEMSIQPFEDCCTIFAPKQPKTRPQLDKVHKFESYLDIDALVDEACAGITITPISAATKVEDDEFDDLF
ncbi:MAG: tRNA 4-thiouridine(8) synthase ThiI [Lactobacillales bacterium]|jgi:thiamine biosynthesis protein ThiI|nr:tRNA 4-thiouridine(8) synthase ThiI [Lactobacillales bacterium]